MAELPRRMADEVGQESKEVDVGTGIFFTAFVGLAYAFEDNILSSYVPVIEILYVVCMFCAGFFAFVLPVIYMLVDLLVHVPRAIHDDTESTMLHAIMVTPITTSSMMRDLTAWAIRFNLIHMAPSLLVISVFIIVNIHQSIVSGYGYPSFSEILPVIIMVTISVAALWHFLLVTGLASAVYPRWVWSTGSTLFFWVIPVLTGVIWATDLIRDELRRLIIERYNPSILGWRVRELDLWEIIIIAVIILEIPTLILAGFLPRLMEKHRSGEWQ